MWRTEGKSDKETTQKQRDRGRHGLPINTSHQRRILIQAFFLLRSISRICCHEASTLYTKEQENNSCKARGNHFMQLITKTKPHRKPEHCCPPSLVGFYPAPAIDPEAKTCLSPGLHLCRCICPPQSPRLPRPPPLCSPTQRRTNAPACLFPAGLSPSKPGRRRCLTGLQVPDEGNCSNYLLCVWWVVTQVHTPFWGVCN